MPSTEGRRPLPRPLPGLSGEVRRRGCSGAGGPGPHLPDAGPPIPTDFSLVAAVAALARAHQGHPRTRPAGPAAPYTAAKVLPRSARGVPLSVQGRDDPQPRPLAHHQRHRSRGSGVHDWFHNRRPHGEIGHIPPPSTKSATTVGTPSPPMPEPTNRVSPIPGRFTSTKCAEISR